MKFLVKYLIPMLMLTLLFAAVVPLTASAASSDISVFIDGTEVKFDVPPAMVNNRTMVPMRAIFETLGAEVEWIPEESGIRATTDTLDVYMQLDNPQITINGVVTELDVAPYLTNNRTLVPLRAVAEAFSASVTWVQDTSSVVIFSHDERYEKELDQTATEVFDPRHLRTSQDGVEYVDLRLTGPSRLRVTFYTSNPETKEFAVRINNGDLIAITAVKPNTKNYAYIDLSEYSFPNPSVLEVYTRDADETKYWSYIYRCIYLEKVNGTYQFASSKMWDYNQEFLSEWVDPRMYLGSNIPEDVIALSDSICKGITDDYKKLLAIHDYVAENMYYDMDDFYNKGSHNYAGVEDLLDNKRSVCQGYADLMTMLVRAQKIPCRQLVGYALGLTSAGTWNNNNINATTLNHAWNQAYVNHRWINIDATWDSDNVYENGEYVYGGIDYHLYFDISNLFMSYNHKILEIN